ncbi:lipoprotein insertase outer membrane protein LolB [Herbaspirillum sp. WKF16]|jgi:outer membrane lipoprotein LolB|uniref:lipoprotein insertase outer membrane protein LolB n=1 Tax=Herbaspirillum sp. WKF16 TaxID=3028312 RepID=UPI0023A9A48E|nr:lipoprotein insertase outer membrane protein LolB [Herbaspirillum sp. WKF16]WDZ95433.1 lipoprotein insertase outer membrane protein LolB [Herbaspirillum sp. WKF16]
MAALRRAAAVGAMSLAALLAGCADLQQSTQAGSGSAPAYRESISLAGRISVQYEQGNAPQSLHGSFIWKQAPREIDLEMLSPLGQTVATINVKPGIATLVQSGRAPQVAPDVDELAAQALGWPLPVSGMRHWLQGTGTDVAGKTFTATPGQEETGFSTRDGWRVVYANWQTDPASGEIRPKRIDMTRNTEQAGKVAIRIAVDSWNQP